MLLLGMTLRKIHNLFFSLSIVICAGYACSVKGLPQESIFLLTHELRDKSTVYIPFKAVLDDDQDKRLTMSTSSKDGRVIRNIIFSKTNAEENSSGFEVKLEQVLAEEHSSSQMLGVLHFFQRNNTYYLKMNNASSRSEDDISTLVKLGVGDQPLKFVRDHEQDEAAMIDLGFIMTLLETESQQKADLVKKNENNRKFDLEELTRKFKSISLDIGEGISLLENRVHIVTGDTNKTYGIFDENKVTKIPVGNFPVNGFHFPQNIKHVHLSESSAGILHVLSYMNIPMVGALLGSFSLNSIDQSSEEETTHYFLHVSPSMENPNEVKISLCQDTKKTSEQSFFQKKPEDYVSITCESNGDCFLKGKGDKGVTHSIAVGPLYFPDFNKKDLGSALIDNINFQNLLFLATILKPQIGENDNLVNVDDLKDVLPRIFSKDTVSERNSVPFEVALSQPVTVRETIKFAQSSISTERTYDRNDRRIGSVYGPVYLHTLGGYGNYFFHIPHNREKEFSVSRFKSDSSDGVWTDIVRHQITGQPLSRDLARLIVLGFIY